jgi:hypothetical protein
MVMNEIHGNGRRGGGEQEEDGTDLTMNHTTIRNFGRNINMNNRNEFYGRDLNLYTQIEEIILENQNDLHLRNGNNGNNGNNGTIRSENVAFFDYAPHIFRRLRMQAKISCANYRHSFRQTTKERVSEGKSGAFFYFTQDRKYVVKTLTQEELKFLLTILPKYDT